MRILIAFCVVLAVVVTNARASAFCGFFVAGGESKLFNNATLTVLMREGTRTVMSMQNNYEGPPEDFAMVVPVPVVLSEDEVRTLPRDVFDRIDTLSAPRLVEYWEQDPCSPYGDMYRMESAPMSAAVAESVDLDAAGDYQVTVEARFTVGEYEIVILSAGESTGLERWLRDGGYKVPAGAAPVLAPYVQQGMKFFVAKVDVEKVRFEGGMAMLSPLRFHFDSIDFSLPIRLGLLNSKGKQDLLTVILARNQRYEVANYDNVTIPTNLEVSNSTRENFGAFYAALFDAVTEYHPGAVVTEYAWLAGSCDPCPGPALTPEDLVTLGYDALPASELDESDVWQAASEFVITRLHARYGKDDAGEDFVFRQAVPIFGGRETESGQTGAEVSDHNNFQGRYIIRHEWTGPIACDEPRRGLWGGPPGGTEPGPVAAKDTAFAPREGLVLEDYVKQPLSELGVLKTTGKPQNRPPRLSPEGGCGSCALGEQAASSSPWLTLGLVIPLGVRRRRRQENFCVSARHTASGA